MAKRIQVFSLFRRILAAIFLSFPYHNVQAEVHGAITVKSNYLGRGYTKSNGDFSYLANVDYQHDSGLYLGSNAAYVNFGNNSRDNEARVEVTPYLGWSFNLSEDWRLDSQWSRYLYDGNIFGHASDYNEFYLFLHYKDLISATVAFSEDFYHRGHAAGSYELTTRYPLTDFLEFSASGGYSQTKSVLEYDYLFWNAGITYFYKFISLDFRYADASETATDQSVSPHNGSDYYPAALKPTFLFSASIGF